MTRLLTWISQAALKHRARIRGLVPSSLHNVVGRVSRRVVQAAEAGDRRLATISSSSDRFVFPEPLFPAEAFVNGRIILVNDGLSAGGTERQIVNTLTGLTSQTNLDASLLCWRLGEDPALSFYAPALDTANVPYRNVGTPHGDVRASIERVDHWLSSELAWVPGDVRDKIRRLAGELVVSKPGVLHAWQDETAIAAAIAGILVGVPRIVMATRNVNPSGFGYYRPFMVAAYRILSHRADIILLNNSDVGARDYETWLGLRPGRFQVIHNGMDTEALWPATPERKRIARQRFGLGPDAPVVGSIMRMNAEKRPDLFIEAAASLLKIRPDTRFLLIGDGAMLGSVRSEAIRLGLGDALITPGPVDPIADALHAMDVFLLTSRFEGLPNVLLEAGLTGLPIVSTKAGGAEETFRDGETGRLVAAADGSGLDDRLAATLADLLDDDAWRMRVRDAGPAFVKERFGLVRMIDETRAAYRSEPSPP
ncbi:MAG: glycosyltransferase [Pseudomonadota bacterium]